MVLHLLLLLLLQGGGGSDGCFLRNFTGVLFLGGMTRGNASGFWSLTVLPGGQGFLRRLGAPGDLFEFRVRGCSQGFLRGSFGRA